MYTYNQYNNFESYLQLILINWSVFKCACFQLADITKTYLGDCKDSVVVSKNNYK